MDLQYFVTVFIGFLLYLCDAKKDRDLQCAVCRALVDEVNYGISQVDPKKTVQVGSFRVDGNGNQNTYKKPYARSEIHLTDLFENICQKFSQYALTKNSKGKSSVIPTSSRDGKGIALKDVTISSEATKQMKYSCETMVEEYEEDMIKVFGKADGENTESQICGDIAELCSTEDLEVPMPSAESPEYTKPESEEVEDEEEEKSDEEEKGDKEEQNGEETKIKEEL